MVNFIYESSTLAMRIIEKLLKARIYVQGLENIHDQPTLFVANHFTRTETFLIPYVIDKYTGEQVNSLAHASLFRGKFGEYLAKLGAVSTKEPWRNARIIGDLITGRKKWVIYPEGAMVKSRDIFDKGKFIIRHPERIGPPRTGAAMLSLSAEFFKREYLRAVEKQDAQTVRRYDLAFNIGGVENVDQRGILVVPVNITYYPIRPGRNVIKQMVKKFQKHLPHNIEEELEIEGNLILGNTDIIIFFGTPLEMGEYMDRHYRILRTSELLFKKIGSRNFFLFPLAQRLTRTFMRRIYHQVCINMDHLVSGALVYSRCALFEKTEFFQGLYASAMELKKLGEYRLHRTISRDLFKIFTDEPYPPLEDIMNLGETLGLVERRDGEIRTDWQKLIKKYPFHDVRVKNTIKVIANEIKSQKPIRKIITKNFTGFRFGLRKKVLKNLLERDREIFEEDYREYFDPELSKPREIGEPFFLEGDRSLPGVLLSHGYLSVPREVYPLAEYLNGQGYTVYGARLRGHGTAPRNLADISYEEWYDSYNRGYAILKNFCRGPIVLGGFSMGGVIALLAAARKGDRVGGVFTINAPIKLRDFRLRLTSAVIFTSELLKKFNISTNRLEYVENNSESPDINYSRNYLRGVKELKDVMDECEENLHQVTSPVLIVQSDGDRVVNPQSARIIYESVYSKKKELALVRSDNHVIVRNESSRPIFERVNNFLQNIWGRRSSNPNNF